MHKNGDAHYCRVCGLYSEDYFPWGVNGESPTFDICECCGCEFGYEDYTLEGISKYREEWLKSGAKWWHPKNKPINWDLEKQLAQIPEKWKKPLLN